MQVKLLAVFLLVSFSHAFGCEDQSFCSTFKQDSFALYCSSFLNSVCPESCGKCAVESLKKKFTANLDENGDGRISVDEGRNLLTKLSIDVNDGMITLIKNLVLDTKVAMSDVYKKFDSNNDETLTIDEVILGVVKLFETIGVKINDAMKIQLNANIEIIKNADTTPLTIPKLNELIEFVIKKIEAYPHGYVTLLRLQSIMHYGFEFDRIITENDKQEYTVNGKFLIRDILELFDLDRNNFVDHKEITRKTLALLHATNVTISDKVNQTLIQFFDLIDKKLINALIKHGFSDLSELNGLTLSEFNDEKFVDSRISIKENMLNPISFSPETVRKYIKSATNSLPIRTISLNTIVEAIFMKYDNNRDYRLDLGEFGEFAVNGLKDIESNLEDFIKVLKVMILVDTNGDGKLDLEELTNLLKPLKYEVY